MTGVVVDTSAVVAILIGEPRSASLADELASRAPRMMAAPTLVELGIVFEARYGAVGGAVVERFVRDAAVEVVGFDRTLADRALEGWRRFGKGRHPAALNLGDCFAYGVAAMSGYPVLCTGEDFAATDVAVIRPTDG